MAAGERRDSEISISQKRGQAGGTATVHLAVGWGPGLSLAGVSRDASGHFHCWHFPSFTGSLRPFTSAREAPRGHMTATPKAVVQVVPCCCLKLSKDWAAGSPE